MLTKAEISISCNSMLPAKYGFEQRYGMAATNQAQEGTHTPFICKFVKSIVKSNRCKFAQQWQPNKAQESASVVKVVLGSHLAHWQQEKKLQKCVLLKH